MAEQGTTAPEVCECGSASMCALCAILIGWSERQITEDQQRAIDAYMASGDDMNGPEYRAMIEAGLPAWGAQA